MSQSLKSALRQEQDDNGLQEIVIDNNTKNESHFKKTEGNWENIRENLKSFDDVEILVINNCPSLDDAVFNFKYVMNEIFLSNQNLINLRIKINDSNLQLNEGQSIELIYHLKSFNKSMLITFESAIDSSCLLYWKLGDRQQILKLSIEPNSWKIGEFVSEFIINSLRENHNGIHSAITFSKQSITCETTLEMLSNPQNFNLLFHASELGHSEIVKYLLVHFNVNQVLEDKLAIDLAYQAEKFETVTVLLNGNSKFPMGFDENVKRFPLELRKFIITSKSMHDAIESGDEEKVRHVLQQNSSLKYFFNLENQSALAFTLEKRAFNIYKIFIEKNISLGPHESFEDIMQNFKSSERKKLSEINLKCCKNLKESYILKLLANSIVGPDDKLKETRCAHVLKAFECLNNIKEIKPLLKFTAAQGNFQLIFDFNRDHVQFLDPKSEAYVSGLFYLNGRIYIGAKHLLDDEKANEVYGVIAHEICHFVMFKVYRNHAKPYDAKDTKNQQDFEKISEYCDVLKDFDEIISLVFTEYDKEQQHAELIVRIPHLLGHYHNNPEKLAKVNGVLTDLYRFYVEHCMKDVKSALESNVEPVIVQRFQYIELGSSNQDNGEANQQIINKKNFNKFAPRIIIGLLIVMVICFTISMTDYDYYIEISFVIGTYSYFIIFPIILLLLAKANFYFQRVYSKYKSKPRGTSEFFKINLPLILSPLLLSLLLLEYCYLEVNEGIKAICEEKKDAKHCQDVDKICEYDEDKEYECDALSSLNTCLPILIYFSIFLFCLIPCLNLKNKMMEIRAQPGSVTKYFAMCTPWKIVYTLFFVVFLVIMIMCDADIKCKSNPILGLGLIFTLILLISPLVRLILHLPREYVKAKSTPEGKAKFLNIFLSWMFVILLIALAGIMYLQFHFPSAFERSKCFYWALICIILLALIIGVKVRIFLQNNSREMETSIENAAKYSAWKIAIALTAVLFGIFITVHLAYLYEGTLSWSKLTMN